MCSNESSSESPLQMNPDIIGSANENGLLLAASQSSSNLGSAVGGGGGGGGGNPTSGILPPLDHYRIQLYNYAMVERLRCTAQYQNGENGVTGGVGLCPIGNNQTNPYSSTNRVALHMSLFQNRIFQQEEPKPQHSYIGLIAMAILSAPETKLVLSDIYQHILDNYPYFRSRGPGWRNSIRHNLSLNDCFIKAGRSANGKGHYWAIHPANLEDFKKGDFRRRKAQRKVRRHMGLVVDDEGTDSPSPPPISISPLPGGAPYHHQSGHPANFPNLYTINQHNNLWGITGLSTLPFNSLYGTPVVASPVAAATPVSPSITPTTSSLVNYKHHISATRKRQFDVASLLAPDEFLIQKNSNCVINKKINSSNLDEDIDVVTSDPELVVHSNYSNSNNNNNNNNINNNNSSNTDQTASWHGFIGSNLVDTRILSRYYGQCMAVAAAQNVCRRYLNQNNSSNTVHSSSNTSSSSNSNYENSSQSSK